MTGRRLTILAWHVHGSWMTSFVQGGHRYLIPADGHQGEWARGPRRRGAAGIPEGRVHAPQGPPG